MVSQARREGIYQAALRAAARRSLAWFVRYMWSVLEPRRKLVWSWHMDVICGEMEKSYRGEHSTYAFVCSIPPRCSKSSLFGVFGPAWRWLHHPQTQFICITASDKNCRRDARLMRLLIESHEYQVLREEQTRPSGNMKAVEGWGWSPAQNELQFFANTSGGYRISITTGTKITGAGADVMVLDDVVDASEAFRMTHTQSTRLMDEIWEVQWKQVWKSRLNPGPSVVQTVMQRLHENDIAGKFIESGAHHLVLPMEYEPEHPDASPLDQRKESGEVLVQRMTPDRIKDLKNDQRFWTTQYQLRPTPAEGMKFKRSLWGRYKGDPRQIVTAAFKVALSLDCANEEKSDVANSVLGAVGHFRTGTGYKLRMLGVRRGRWELPELIQQFNEFEQEWPTATEKLIEYAANGIALVQIKQRETTGIIPVNPRGDKEYPGGSKEDRAQHTLTALQSGMWELPEDRYAMLDDGKCWTQEMIEEHASFPLGTRKDYVDMASQVSIRALIDDAGSYEEQVEQDWGFLFDM